METFTVSAAARVCGVDRRTLQRAIQAGRLHLDAQHCLSREELVAAGYLDSSAPQDTPQITSHYMPQETPHELVQATALLALLERLTAAIADLHEEVRSLREDLQALAQRMPQGRRRRAPTAPQIATTLTPQDTPQESPMSQMTPQDTPQVVRHAAETPQPTPATAPSLDALPDHIQRIAEAREQYERLTLRDFAQLLHARAIYRTKTGGVVNAGTLQRWLAKAGLH